MDLELTELRLLKQVSCKIKDYNSFIVTKNENEPNLNEPD